MSVRRERLEELGLSPSQTALALTLVLSGGLIYYIIPYAFILRDFDLLLSSLNAILMGTIGGLIVLAALLQPPAEALVAHCIVWGVDRRLLGLVLRNLEAHRGRGRKMALLFTSTLAFLIFASTMFALQARVAQQHATARTHTRNRARRARTHTHTRAHSFARRKARC